MQEHKTMAIYTQLDWAFGRVSKSLQKYLKLYGWEVDLFDWSDRDNLKKIVNYDIVFTHSWCDAYQMVQNYPTVADRIVFGVQSELELIYSDILDSNSVSFREITSTEVERLTMSEKVVQYFNKQLVIQSDSQQITNILERHGITNSHLAEIGVDTEEFNRTQPYPDTFTVVISLRELKNNPIEGMGHHYDVKRLRLVEKVREQLKDYPIVMQFTPRRLNLDEMNAFYNQGDVFLSLSRSEGSPCTLSEAMACGLVPVITNVGVVPELIIDGENGLVLKEKDEELLVAEAVEKILYLYHNLPTLRIMQKAARKRVLDIWDWSIKIQKWNYLFEQKYQQVKSNMNKWNDWYKNLPSTPQMKYGTKDTYEKGRDFLSDCKIVEDWGTGSGAFKLFRPDAIGVDGSDTPHAQIKADLEMYTSSCDGVFLRHILEHNFKWKDILVNALKSAEKVVVIFFEPLNDTETVLLREATNWNRENGVDTPVLSISRAEFLQVLNDAGAVFEEIPIGSEIIFLINSREQHKEVLVKNDEFELSYQMHVSNILRDNAAHTYMMKEMQINQDLQGKRILDVGGGPNSILLRVINNGASVIVDPTKYTENISGLSSIFNSKNILFVCSTLEDLPIQYANYDEVWCYNTIMHTENSTEFIESLKQRVKPGGIFRIMEPLTSRNDGHHPTTVTNNTFDSLKTSSFEIIKEDIVNYNGEGLFFDDHLVLIVKRKEQVEKLRIHIYGLPHTLTVRNDPRMMTCAYTTKVWLLCKKFMEEGHEVIHYGVEGSVVPCTENVGYIPFALWDKHCGHRDEKSFHVHDRNSEIYQYAAAHLPEEINKRIKDPSREVVLASFGFWSDELLKINKAALIEFGIGYDYTFTNYRAFESYAWQHSVYGKRNELIAFKGWVDAVIPGYIDPEEFEYSDKKENYLLFVGRIIDTKGIFIAAQLAQKFGLKLKIAGNGDTSWINNDEYKDVIEYVGVVGVEEKKKLYKYAKATLCMTLYVEPFGNVHMESLMAGTPVISTDWGVYTETVSHGVVGYRVRTWEDCLYALKNIDKISSQKCREWAMATWSLDAVYPKFNAYFEKCATHFTKGNWYFEQDERKEHISNYAMNYEEYTKIHVAVVLDDNLIEKGVKAIQSFGRHHVNYDVSIIHQGISEENKARLSNLQHFKQFIQVDKKYGVFWAKAIAMKEVTDKGKLLIIDTDMIFMKDINDFLFFADNEYIHAADDFASPKKQDEFNKSNKLGETYFQKSYFEVVPDLKKYENEITANCGLIAIDCNNRKSKLFLNEFAEKSNSIHQKVTNWPFEQGLFNYLILGKYKSAFKMYDYTYNSSPYNKGLLEFGDDKLRVIHYHGDSVLKQFEERYAFNSDTV